MNRTWEEDQGLWIPGARENCEKNLQWQKQREHQLHVSNRKFSITYCHCILKNGCSDRYEASLMAQRQRIHPPMQETYVRSVGQKDPLEEEMTAHSNILAMDRGA